MTSAISVPSRELVNYPPEFNQQVISALDTASSEITALQGSGGALDWKNSVLCATTAALAANTRVGNVLTANANGALGAIDGVTPTAGKRILVKDEATQANNGWYDVTSAGAGGAPWVLTRASDADESAEVTPNAATMVEQGTVNAEKIFVLNVAGPITLNTTALVFEDWRGLAITAPVDVTKAAAAVGTAITLARADHKHDVSTGIVGSVSIGDVAAEGVATSLARSDHTHGVAGGSPVSIGTANSDGVATTFARADHVHSHGTQTDATLHAAATQVDNGFMSSADKTKLDSIQTGTATLVAGTVTVAATITASSRIPAPGITDPGAGAITGLAGFKITNKVIGAPGSFDITAIDDTGATIATAICVLDWLVVN